MIHIHTAVVWNTIDYAYYMVQNAAEMSKDPRNLRFSIYCQDKHAWEFVKRSEQFAEYGAQVVPVLQSGQGSAQHAATITEMVRRFSPDAHNAVLDGDTVILCPDWDELIESMLKKHHFVGACYDHKLCVFEAQYYRRIPTFTWLVVRLGVDLSQFDVSPAKDDEFIVTDESSALYGVPAGHKLVRDTGWRLPAFIASNEMKALGFETSRSPKVFRPDTIYSEYHYDDEPFLAHMQRSSRLPFRMSQLSREFYDSCERYLEVGGLGIFSGRCGKCVLG